MANLPIQALWIICRTNNKTDFLFLIIYYSSKTVPYHIFYAFCLRQRKISILLLILSLRMWQPIKRFNIFYTSTPNLKVVNSFPLHSLKLSLCHQSDIFQ